MNGVIAMHGMDAVRRAARWSAGPWLAAALIALGPVPPARAEVPSLPAIAATNAAPSVSKRTVAVPPLIAAPAAYVDASDSETSDDQALLDDPAADSTAQDSDSDDLVGDAADAAGDDASNWLTMLGLDQTLLPWVGDREMADSPTRPLLIPDNKRVDSVVRYFLTKRRRVLEVGYRRSTRYLSTIRTIFTEAGIPPKLAYLAAVESNYNPIAHSRARAAGMWQFMSFTAKKYGLKVRLPWYDERLDPVYSTRAAARLLAYLHDEYGSWELALAAYNAGEGRVNRAIRRAQQPEGQEDYWTLRRLPRETKGYVPAFFALARIYEDPETYGLDHLEQDPEVELEAIEIDVSTSLAELAKLVDIPYEELRRLNPAWKRGFIPPIGIGPVLLHLPSGHGPRVQQILADNPPPPVSWRVHTVGRGETLSEIARVYGVSLKELMAVNNLRNPRVLSVGQIITLPLAKGITAAPQWDPPDMDDQPPRRVRSRPQPVAKVAAAPGPGQVKTVHKVQSGDTLWSIAQRYGVDLADLKRWNGLRGSFLKLDRELVVFVAR